jgi:hypothetical protein
LRGSINNRLMKPRKLDSLRYRGQVDRYIRTDFRKRFNEDHP